MGRTRRQELFWLALIVLCIGLFVAHRTKEQPAGYDRRSMDALVQESWKQSTYQSNDELVTGSIAPQPRARPAAPAAAPASAKKYYVSFGNYDSIEMATKRYLDVVGRKPALKGEESISIETLRSPAGDQHRVRMGEFNTAWGARSTCLKAGFYAEECKVIPAP